MSLCCSKFSNVASTKFYCSPIVWCCDFSIKPHNIVATLDGRINKPRYELHNHRRVTFTCLFHSSSKVPMIGKFDVFLLSICQSFLQKHTEPLFYKLIPFQIGSLQGLLPRFLIRLNIMQRAFLIGNLHHKDF